MRVSMVGCFCFFFRRSSDGNRDGLYFQFQNRTARVTPFYEHSGVTLYHGDCVEVLRSLPDESVNCCITIPPYWGLRDYGVEGQIGLENTPGEYVDKMVDVFISIRRVLRSDGTVWLNLGDSYAANRGYQVPDGKFKDVGNGKSSSVPDGLKPKDLVGIPWRVALALQADGWYLRSDIIWAKSNPMPESVTDLPTRSHEYVFLLAKSEKYYYDAAAIAEKAVCADMKKFTDGGVDKQRGHSRRHAGFNGRYAESLAQNGVPTTRNKRDVWNVNTEPFPDAHFAVFPPALILPCVLAGCPAGGVVIDPFNGAGTTAMVAKENGRRAIGCDLNAEYLEMSVNRLQQEVLFA